MAPNCSTSQTDDTAVVLVSDDDMLMININLTKMDFVFCVVGEKVQSNAEKNYQWVGAVITSTPVKQPK